MATWSNTLSGNSNYRLDLIVNQSSQNVSANTSTVSYTLNLVKTSGSGYWTNDNSLSYNVVIDGTTVASGTTSYDFRNAIPKTITLASGTRTITHNADGTKSISCSGYASDSANGLGSRTVSGSLALTTIPRASQPSLSSGSTASGNAVIIYTNRASNAFTHTLTYSFGSYNGTIATGVTDSASWTIPVALMNAIPNSTSGTGTITCVTYNGSTNIGSKSVAFTMTVPASIVPSFTTITHSERTSSVSTNVGAYVKTLSALNLAITGASGIYGSSITTYRITCNGDTISTVSGATSALKTSGTLSIVGTITDSRGRTASKTVTINVLDYSVPTVGTVSAIRCNSDGTDNALGSYIKVTVNGTTKSLVNGSEKNNLRYTVQTQPKGGSYTTKVNTTISALTFSGVFIWSGYDVSTSFNVLISISDKFNSSSKQQSVTVGKVALDIGDDNIGVGKLHEQGTIDALGQVYQNDGAAVVDITQLITQFLSKIYPIGSIYMSVTNTSPASFLGGTWAVWGAGRVPVGVDSSQTEFNAVQKTGGAKTHTLTVAQLPSHTHNMNGAATAIANSNNDLVMGAGNPPTGNVGKTTATGSGEAHNNLQPYITCYMWRRTA